MKVILFNPTGSNPMVKELARGLIKAKLLAEFWITVAVFPGTLLDRVAKFSFLGELRRRKFDPEFEPYIKTNPWREMGRHIAGKLGLKSLLKHETGFFNIDSVSKSLDSKVAAHLKEAQKNGVQAVLGYEDVTAYSFRAAKKLNIRCIYEQPIGYWRAAHRLLKIEAEKWPEWASTLTGFMDSDAKLARKDEELSLADLILAASNFTADTLKEYPGKLAPVKIVPYGFPPVNPRDYDSFEQGRKIRLLFVGTLSQRKGIANLLAAVDALSDKIELTLVGYKASDNCAPLNAAVQKYNWIPTLSHDGVLELMRQNDVFVFPSLFEGFGLVLTEAMSQGTPVITTERTAGPNLIEHGVDGWLIEAGSTRALIETLENLIANPEQLEKAGRKALEKAKSRPWESYGEDIAECINELLK